jgi:hypothetical protein
MQEPTSQLPLAPAVGPSSWSSLLRRHRWFALIGAVVVVAAVVGGVAWALVGTGGAGPSAAAAPVPSASPSGRHRGPGQGVRGSVVSESGSTWTLRKRSGATVTVVITPQTTFGTKKAPMSATQIPVGTTVAVTGPLTDNTITATWISAAVKPSATPVTSTSPATSGG